MFVRYIGTSSTRVITKAQWAEEGVKDQDTVTWTKANNYAVPYTQLTEDAIAVLARDPMMIQVENYWDPEEEYEARRTSAVRRLRQRRADAAAAI